MRRVLLVRLATEALLLPLHLYRWLVSPLLPSTCRFRPTCSRYAVRAVRRHGILRGTHLAARRVLRCHPFGEGGIDPVP